MPRIKDLVQYFTAQQSKLICDFLGGWEEPDEIWAYSSSTQITVPTGASSRFAVGDRIRFKQGGSYKYYVVYGIPSATTVNISGGTDYTVANAAITDIGISRHPAPNGFPEYFNISPTFGTAAGNLANITSNVGFQLTGKRCDLAAYVEADQQAANSGYWTMNLPFTSSSLHAANKGIFPSFVSNGVTFPPSVVNFASTTQVQIYPGIYLVDVFTIGVDRFANFTGFYYIA